MKTKDKTKRIPKIFKVIALIVGVIIAIPVLLTIFIKIMGNFPPEKFVKYDNERLAEVQKLRDKSTWKKYTNNELGFSLLIPQDSEPYSLIGAGPKEGGRFQYQTDIEFTRDRQVYIPTTSAENIEVSIVTNFQRVKHVPAGKDITYNYVQEYIHNFPLYAEQKGITLQKLENTDLIQISGYQYHHYGDKNLAFTFTGGEHIEWMLNNSGFNFIFGYQSKAADEIKRLQLEILQTLEFFPPGSKIDQKM